MQLELGQSAKKTGHHVSIKYFKLERRQGERLCYKGYNVPI